MPNRGPGPVAVGRLVGRNVARMRNQRRSREPDAWSQDDLGRRLEPFLGRALSRKNVSVLENGGRKLAVEEIVALALVFEVPVAELFAARAGEEISFSKSDLLAPAGLISGAREYADESLRNTAAMVLDHIAEARSSLDVAETWAETLAQVPQDEQPNTEEEG